MREPFTSSWERIDQTKIVRLANRIGEFYNLPQEVVTKAQRAPAFLVNGEQLLEVGTKLRLENDLGVQTLRKNLKFEDKEEDLLHTLARETLRQHFAVYEATVFRRENMILIRKGTTYYSKDMLLRHELIHLMTRGFNREILDEAATDFLVAAEQNRHTSLRDLALMLGGGHQFEAGWLAILLGLTHLDGGIPITTQDLATIYFGGANSADFINRIRESVPKDKLRIQEVSEVIKELESGPDRLLPSYL